MSVYFGAMSDGYKIHIYSTTLNSILKYLALSLPPKCSTVFTCYSLICVIYVTYVNAAGYNTKTMS